VPGDSDAVLGRLLQHSRLAVPDDLPRLIEEHLAAVGAASATLFLVDHDQRELVAVLPPGSSPVAPIAIDGTLAGRCFRLVVQQESGLDELWVPVVDGVERLGVLHLSIPAPRDDVLIRDFAAVLAEMVLSKDAYGDALHHVRRQQPMTLAAEIAWNLLPPLTFGTHDVTISAVIAPAYRVGGDAFDYAVDAVTAKFAIFDAMGHGLEAGLLATVAIGAYRNSRRNGHSMSDTLLAIDQAVSDAFGEERFVTGAVAELDRAAGRLRVSLCGHPAPLLLRHGQIVKELNCPTGLPFGMGSPGEIVEDSLEPGDAVLLFSDGVTDARTADGDFFGVERLGHFVARKAADKQPVPETMRGLMHALLDSTPGDLKDDATTLLVEWRGGAAERVVEG
jgi:hypothetical protein